MLVCYSCARMVLGFLQGNTSWAESTRPKLYTGSCYACRSAATRCQFCAGNRSHALRPSTARTTFLPSCRCPQACASSSLDPCSAASPVLPIINHATMLFVAHTMTAIDCDSMHERCKQTQRGFSRCFCCLSHITGSRLKNSSGVTMVGEMTALKTP